MNLNLLKELQLFLPISTQRQEREPGGAVTFALSLRELHGLLLHGGVGVDSSRDNHRPLSHSSQQHMEAKVLQEHTLQLAHHSLNHSNHHLHKPAGGVPQRQGPLAAASNTSAQRVVADNII